MDQTVRVRTAHPTPELNLALCAYASPERDEPAVFSSPVVKAESAEADFAEAAADPSPLAYLAVAAD
jgi:hypothetical protein